MSSIKVKTVTGSDKGSAELPDGIFGVEPNVAVMHQVVTAQLAAARAGTQSTKTRAEVKGGGAKPWRQKGTGRARQGSIRAPHWRGGGVAHGPKPRSYKQKTPKKMVRLALIGALSDRASESKLLVVDEWGWDVPKTKDALAALVSLGIHTPGERYPRVLLVLDRTDETAWKSFRNLGDRIRIILPEELNTYDVLVSDWLVFTQGTLDTTVARLTAAPKANGETATEVEIAPAPAAAAEPEADPEPAATDDEGADE
jgi:large subunit ribosomal protein L4